jgi:glutamate-ammonia-ligase adenylyltransferase
VIGEGTAETRRSAAARLAVAGVDVERGRQLLEGAGLWNDGEPDGQLLELISDTADPDDALLAITAFAEAHPAVFAEIRRDAQWLARVVALAGTSRPLGELLTRHADAAQALRTLEPVDVEATARRVRAFVAASEDPDEQAAGIAAVRRRATADIAARDLTGAAGVERVAAELAGLAEGVLTGALAGLHRQMTGGAPTARIAVIGMGKLGGYELNYVSDVDVIFVHCPVDGAGSEETADEARRVLERLLRLINASTTMGRAYEIDPTLRPEGRNGPLSRTVDSFVAYWQRWAKTWEFQALIKARPVAGDRELGDELLRRAEPFIYPDTLDPAVVAEIRAMKGRVEAKPEVLRHGERQLKLGPGGLRDIEFAVQLLQLVHGRADRSLRVTGTFPALRVLSAGGYIAHEDADTFTRAYSQLRRIEHHLQLAHERRTHTIPADAGRQEWLARSLGYRPTDDEPARAAFIRDLRALQSEVRELHAKLFYRPLLEAHASVRAEHAGLTLPHEVRAMGEGAARTRLEALGFRDANAALRDVRALTAGVSRRAATLRAILPAMLNVLQESPDPDGGLRMLRTLVETHGRTSKFLDHLRDHPPAADLLARVVGTSEVAGELLLAQPQGVVWLRDADLWESGRTRDELVELARGRLQWQDYEAALRRFKRHELLRTVLRDVADRASVSSVSEELTALGEACLEAALVAVRDRIAEDEGMGSGAELPVRTAIIGLGKLGGRELHYVSDLDVVFVHAAHEGTADREANRLALRIAEQVMRSLSAITAEGTAFEVDVDLRPEGRSGPLSRTLASYRSYHERWGEPWERQAMLKARHVAGDEELGGGFLQMAQGLAYPEHFSERDVAAMRRMKARIERERVDRRNDPKRNLKLGPGGLSDVEWTVQLLQQRHGHDHPGVRTTNTMAALDMLQDSGLLEHRDAAWLRDGYRFLTRVRNRLYLLRQRNVDALPKSPDISERLARSLRFGRGGRQEFEEEYRRHTRHVRRVVEQVFYDIEPQFQSPGDG